MQEHQLDPVEAIIDAVVHCSIEAAEKYVNGYKDPSVFSTTTGKLPHDPKINMREEITIEYWIFFTHVCYRYSNSPTSPVQDDAIHELLSEIIMRLSLKQLLDQLGISYKEFTNLAAGMFNGAQEAYESCTMLYAASFGSSLEQPAAINVLEKRLDAMGPTPLSYFQFRGIVEGLIDKYKLFDVKTDALQYAQRRKIKLENYLD